MARLAAVIALVALAGCADLRFAWTAQGTYNIPPPAAAVAPAAPTSAASAPK